MSFLIICTVAGLASVMTFFSGFGLGTLLLPALALFFAIEKAVALTAIVHFLNGIFKLLLVRKHVNVAIVLRFGLPAARRDEYNYKSGYSYFMTNDYRIQQATKGFLLFRVIMGLIVGISVVVGGIGVMNVLLISVTERTAEIGIRKATGANRKDIILLFLTESITVSAFGSMLGLLLGVLGTMMIIPIVKAITDVPFQAAYTWNTFMVISIISVLVGVIFGTYPAIRASRLDPVEAIRHE